MAGFPSSFLGRGWSFPPEFDASTGDAKMVEDEADIDASLRILFGTATGERFLVPDYGVDLREAMFEAVSTTLRTFLVDRIRLNILLYEPRIRVQKLDIEQAATESGLLRILLEYEVRATNSRYNLVFPFYSSDAVERAIVGGGR
jgi:uncharacterized protein